MQINLKFKKCSSTDLINLFLLTCHFLKFQAAFVKRQKKLEKRGTECSVTVIPVKNPDETFSLKKFLL